jgi:hypothetical protein
MGTRVALTSCQSACPRCKEIKPVIDEPCSTFAVRRGLRSGEARQSYGVDAAEFAVDIGGVHV